MSQHWATTAALVLVAGYTPLAILLGLLSRRFVRGNPATVILATSLVTLVLVTCLSVGFLWMAGEFTRLVRFLFIGKLSWWWFPLALVLGALLYHESSRVTLPLLGKAMRAMGMLSAIQHRPTVTGTLRTYLSPWVLATMPLANLVEEVLWRGVTVYTLMLFGVPFLGAAAIAGLIYGTYHYSLGVHHSLLNGRNGFVYGLVFWKSQHILVPFLAHMAYNLVSIHGMRRALHHAELLERGRQMARV